MLINTNAIYSMTQANQNFSQVARTAEREGEAVVFKNNKPKYLVVDLENSDYLLDLTEDVRNGQGGFGFIVRHGTVLSEIMIGRGRQTDAVFADPAGPPLLHEAARPFFERGLVFSSRFV